MIELGIIVGLVILNMASIFAFYTMLKSYQLDHIRSLDHLGFSEAQEQWAMFDKIDKIEDRLSKLDSEVDYISSGYRERLENLEADLKQCRFMSPSSDGMAMAQQFLNKVEL